LINDCGAQRRSSAMLPTNPCQGRIVHCTTIPSDLWTTMSQRMITTKAFLLTSTAALVLLASPSYPAAAQSGTILLAQQQEPAEKSDRPERKRPEGAPGAPARPQGAPKQGAPAGQEAPPAVKQAPPKAQTEQPSPPAAGRPSKSRLPLRRRPSRPSHLRPHRRLLR
jgi:hypothetical protein